MHKLCHKRFRSSIFIFGLRPNQNSLRQVQLAPNCLFITRTGSTNHKFLGSLLQSLRFDSHRFKGWKFENTIRYLFNNFFVNYFLILGIILFLFVCDIYTKLVNIVLECQMLVNLLNSFVRQPTLSMSKIFAYIPNFFKENWFQCIELFNLNKNILPPLLIILLLMFDVCMRIRIIINYITQFDVMQVTYSI